MEELSKRKDKIPSEHQLFLSNQAKELNISNWEPSRSNTNDNTNESNNSGRNFKLP